MLLCLGPTCVVGLGWGFDRHIYSSADHVVHESTDKLSPHTAVIVLGARVYSDATPSPVLEDRLRCALDIYRAGLARRVLVSGDHGQKDYDEVNAMQTWLTDRGVPSEDVFLDHAGFRTYDTMERAAQVFEIDDALICTQRFHLHRAAFLARSAGIDAQGVVADRRVYADANANARRERLARIRAVLDVYLPFTSPTHLGDPIPIDGDARQTHDKGTR